MGGAGGGAAPAMARRTGGEAAPAMARRRGGGRQARRGLPSRPSRRTLEPAPSHERQCSHRGRPGARTGARRDAGAFSAKREHRSAPRQRVASVLPRRRGGAPTRHTGDRRPDCGGEGRGRAACRSWDGAPGQVNGAGSVLGGAGTPETTAARAGDTSGAGEKADCSSPRPVPLRARRSGPAPRTAVRSAARTPRWRGGDRGA